MENKVFELTNKNGMKVKVTEFGANVMEIWVPDRDGNLQDIVMGFETPDDYKDNKCFFGACIGRMANRINDAKFVLDGKEYSLPVNDGKNNLILFICHHVIHCDLPPSICRFSANCFDTAL